MAANEQVRVATTQYRVTNDVKANLDKLLALIDQAADGGAQLVVAPEFGNHTSFYMDNNHAWDVAVTLDSPYVKAVQEKARERGLHVVFNATRRGEEKPTAYITNFLIGPDGELIGYDDKQVLMGGEAQNLCGAREPGKVYDTAIGRIGMMSCLDGVPPETARNLALRGAQIITNSHNSCALDEPYAHIPARAAENHVWVIASGKVGPICEDDVLEPLAAQVNIPVHLITALGENPILDPMGNAISQLPCLEEAVAFADIEPERASNKSWEDGDLMKDRRPELYGAVVAPPIKPQDEPKAAFTGAIVSVRSNRPLQININRALDLMADAVQNGAQLVVLPELCVFDLAQLRDNPSQALEQSQKYEQALAQQCRTLEVYAATSLVSEDSGLRHTGILLNPQGQRVGHYHQTHLLDSDKAWAVAGDELPVWDTELGRISMMLGYDALFPEVATVLARKGAEILLHPTRWHFDWELRFVIGERATENRVSILSAARFDSRVKRGGQINAMSNSVPLRASDLNPIWPVEVPFERECHISAVIDPARSRNKDLLGFDLQLGRRTELYGELVAN